MTARTSERPASSAVDRPAPALLRWAPVVAFGLLLLGLSRNAGLGITDPDTPWHVLAGRHLWETWQFTGPDPYSRFTTEPWVLNQWLPDLALAAADHLGGLAAVAWLAQLWRLGLCVLLYAACRRRAGSLPAAFVAGVALLGTAAPIIELERAFPDRAQARLAIDAMLLCDAVTSVAETDFSTELALMPGFRVKTPVPDATEVADGLVAV